MSEQKANMVKKLRQKSWKEALKVADNNEVLAAQIWAKDVTDIIKEVKQQTALAKDKEFLDWLKEYLWGKQTIFFQQKFWMAGLKKKAQLEAEISKLEEKKHG